MDNLKYHHFLDIAKALNKTGIIPLLMGSLGMEVLTKKDWYPQDIDIHVPGDKRGWDAPGEQINDWIMIKVLMMDLGYQLIDLHEHEFIKDDIHVEIGNIDTLYSFSGVMIHQLRKITTHDVTFYLPNEQQFYQIYQASLKDSYRQNKNNQKDVDKINYLETII